MSLFDSPIFTGDLGVPSQAMRSLTMLGLIPSTPTSSPSNFKKETMQGV